MVVEAYVTRWVARWTRGGMALVVAVGLGASLGGAAARAAQHDPNWWRPKPQRVKVLPRVPLRPVLPSHRLPKVPEGVGGARQWPAAGSAVVRFGRSGRLARAGGLPVLAGAVGLPGAGARVRVFGQGESRKLGLSGVVFTVSAPVSGLVSVGLNYSRFAGAIGGDFAGRLHLVQLPSCALTSPGAPRCRVRTP